VSAGNSFEYLKDPRPLIAIKLVSTGDKYKKALQNQFSARCKSMASVQKYLIYIG
jgi:hypothetical protein